MRDLFSFSEKPPPGEPFTVKVTPNARHGSLRIEKIDGKFHILVSVTAPPEGGKANAAVIDALAEALGTAKSRIELIRGASGRHKLFRIREN